MCELHNIDFCWYIGTFVCDSVKEKESEARRLNESRVGRVLRRQNMYFMLVQQ